VAAVTTRGSPAELTGMQWAFLDALVRWAARQTRSNVTLPVGRVDQAELQRVVLAVIASAAIGRSMQ
jgi:hypothetical protein